MVVENAFQGLPSFMKMGRIHTDAFICVVGSEGLLHRGKTMVAEGDNNLGVSLETRIQIVYVSSLTKEDRLRYHDFIVETLDKLGETGQSLNQALQSVVQSLDDQGVLQQIRYPVQ